MEVRNLFPHLPRPFREDLEQVGKVQRFPQGTKLIKEGQFIKVIPVVLEGLIKVFTRHEDRELLLYYIEPGESCVMSFAASIQNERCHIFAVTEEESEVLLIPADYMAEWRKNYPDINTFFFQLYNQRYSELLDTINHLLFDRLETRVMNYLVQKVQLTKKNPLKVAHKQIAFELGTSREVISRLVKKLEKEGKLEQIGHQIRVIEM